MKNMMKRTMQFAALITLIFLLVYDTDANLVSARPDATWPDVSLQPVVSGLVRPVFITHAGDGSGRLFIVEQDGRILFHIGAITTEFLNISDRVRSPVDSGGNEEGLLSMAFPPGYGVSKDYFYVYYTNLAGDNQVSRFHIGASPDAADASSEELILWLEHPGQSNHNGGQLAFGADGYLYIGTGDGGGGNDPYDNAQNPASLLGKMLRIDTEMVTIEMGTTPSLDTYQNYLPIQLQNVDFAHSLYRIPSDNPFIDTLGYRPEIWALGLRNPWRFSFDRLTHDLYIGDVGQGEWEEIDFQPAISQGGENYGWDIFEGSMCTSTSCDPSGMTMPVHEYNHNQADCSVSGGYVYRGAAYSGMQGIYFFGDYCTGKIWGLQQETVSWTPSPASLVTNANGLASFGENEAGELFIANRNSGSILQLIESSR